MRLRHVPQLRLASKERQGANRACRQSVGRAESASGPETFVLYFLATAEEIIACIQRDTLEAALDEALSLTGLAHDCWVACDVSLDEATSLRRSVVIDKREVSGA